MNLSKDIRSLSDFKRNTGELMEQIAESGEPLILTVNGKAKLVVLDTEAYQELIDSIDDADAVAGIRRGLDDVKNGRTIPVDEAFERIRKKHRIPRNPRP
jgi:prevent-host-death family protein